MNKEIFIDSIQYDKETVTTYGEHTIYNETISATVVTATVQVNGVIMEGQYKFSGLLDSRKEIAQKIADLYK